jgi:hypothetical protein
LGVFVGFRSDLNWADIAERNGEVRSHPLKWLGHARARPKNSEAIEPNVPATTNGVEKETRV